MLPMFVPPPESDNDDPNTRLRAKIALVLGLVVAMVLGGVMFFLRSGTGGATWVIFIAIIAIAIVMGITMMLQAGAQSRRKAKHKATLEDLEDADVYSKMNKFVEDINEAEAEYLQRKLKERGILRPDDAPEVVDVEDAEQRDDQRG